VANVGGASGGPLLDSTREDWERTPGLNLLHAVDARSCAKVGWSDWQGSCRLVWQDAARTNRTTQRAAKKNKQQEGQREDQQNVQQEVQQEIQQNVDRCPLRC
jgi:hypothetical protein